MQPAGAASLRLADAQVRLALYRADTLHVLVDCSISRRAPVEIETAPELEPARERGLKAISRVTAEARAAQAAIEPLLPTFGELVTWASFRQLHRLGGHDDIVWHRTYVALSAKHVGWHYSVQRLTDGVAPGHQNATRSRLLDEVQQANRAVEDQDRESVRRLEAESQRANEAEVAALAARDLAASHFSSLGKGEGFGLALEVLAFLAASTVAVPLSLMAGGVGDAGAIYRAGLVCLFLSGVGSLFAYLFAYASLLRSGNGREEMPSHLLGLFAAGPRPGPVPSP